MQGLTGSQYADRDLRAPPDLIGLVRSAWRDTLESEPIKTMDVLHADNVRGHAALLAQVMCGQRDEPVNDA